MFKSKGFFISVTASKRAVPASKATPLEQVNWATRDRPFS